MTIMVTITDGDREVRVVRRGDPPAAAVVADALTAWSRGVKRRSRGDDRPSTVNLEEGHR